MVSEWKFDISQYFKWSVFKIDVHMLKIRSDLFISRFLSHIKQDNIKFLYGFSPSYAFISTSSITWWLDLYFF